YYLTRKPSFYAVKRAFAPRKLVLRAREDNVVVFAMNESAEEVKTVLEIGTLRLDGDCISRKSIEVSIPPRFSGILASIKKASSDAERVLWYARCPAASGFSPATLREGELRKLKLDKPGLSITGLKRSKGTISFKVKSQRFAHAVHFGLPWEVEASDEYFDLLPGEERRITLTASNDKLPATVTARSVIPGADASQ
ncbi:MAG TPA: glycoside hydrolase family 2 protein, partial [Spirochaetia bacterium]|nr:glycoside hydrolase family 2 protein [Spirochaetia bacterium]